MALTLNGSNNTIAGLAVGGLPDGIVDTDMLAANAVVTGKITDGTIASSDIASGVIPSAGLSNVDQWRVTSNFTGDANPISSNLERIDTVAGLIGSAMTESSGIFTFPQTGVWRVEYNSTYFLDNDVNRYCESYMYYTTDDSNYSEAARSTGANFDANNNCYANNYLQYNFDVTNVSTHKVKFTQNVLHNSTITMGDTNKNFTYFTFTRLGDT